MPKIRSLFLLGLLIIILPFLGFPSAWKSMFMVIIGFFVSLLTFLHYKDMKRKYRVKVEKKAETPLFVENEMNSKSFERQAVSNEPLNNLHG